MEKLARSILAPILSVLEWISAILIFVMMVLTFADVVGRYLFKAPIFGAAEMIQFLLAMTIFAGLSLVNAHDDHITVELFEERIRQRIPRLHRFLIQGFSVVAMALIAWQLAEYAVEAQERNSVTVVLEWPLSIVAGAVAGFSFISLIAQLLGLALPDRREPGTPVEDGL
ncbi:TRAP transporter small permease [Hoeflea sp. TYP-13]|uniref:TRAP transporter small permease n=1 Tax=Hoeflea sp. TYP-13 TaxID=3230023 RepID=UPI0034C6DB76